MEGHSGILCCDLDLTFELVLVTELWSEKP